MTSATHRDDGRPRVQRLVDDLRPVHLEAAIPIRSAWELAVDGLVAKSLRFSTTGLAALPVSEREIDLHCVWGWSRPGCRWDGVAGSDLLELCRPLVSAACAVFTAADGTYSSCVRLDDVADGIVAWKLDGEAIPSVHGGPLRFVPPARLWGYKGVKWLARIEFVDSFRPGLWEQKVGDVEGRVPEDVLEQFRRGRGSTHVGTRLDDVIAKRGIGHRDCRDCRNFRPDEGGLQYGWCSAHKQHVKLYHPAESWYSQCLFKSLRRLRPGEVADTSGGTPRSDVSPASESSSDSA